MKTCNYPPIIIFSVYQGLDEFNDIGAHVNAAFKLKEAGILFTEVKGCYNGKTEKAFMVSAEHRHAAEQLALEFNQESIFYSGPDRFSWLEFLGGGGAVPLGTLVPASKAEAIEAGNYTSIGNGKDTCYYITKKHK